MSRVVKLRKNLLAMNYFHLIWVLAFNILNLIVESVLLLQCFGVILGLINMKKYVIIGLICFIHSIFSPELLIIWFS
jgi:hypothetical protein